MSTHQRKKVGFAPLATPYSATSPINFVETGLRLNPPRQLFCVMTRLFSSYHYASHLQVSARCLMACSMLIIMTPLKEVTKRNVLDT